MSITSQPLPRWIQIVSFIFGIIAVAVAANILFNPATAASRLEVQARGVTYLVKVVATRQFAMGCIFLFAASRRSAPMLTLAYLLAAIVNAGHIITCIAEHDNALLPMAAGLLAVSCVMEYFIAKAARRRHGNQHTSA